MKNSDKNGKEVIHSERRNGPDCVVDRQRFMRIISSIREILRAEILVYHITENNSQYNQFIFLY